MIREESLNVKYGANKLILYVLFLIYLRIDSCVDGHV